MKIVFSETPSELPSYDFYKAKKTRGENIPVETILDILVPLQTETTRTVTKLKKEAEFGNENLLPPAIYVLQL